MVAGMLRLGGRVGGICLVVDRTQETGSTFVQLSRLADDVLHLCQELIKLLIAHCRLESLADEHGG